MALKKSHKRVKVRNTKKIYKMKGCSKGGSNGLISSDSQLAYTGKPIPNVQPNPYLAYNGKGGSSCGLIQPASIPQNINGTNPINPNTGPPFYPGSTIYNSAYQQNGGGCGCGMPQLMKGGMCGPACLAPLGFMVAGSRHRKGCLCPKCKKNISKMSRKMRGGNVGIPYPAGLVGSPLIQSQPATWPGVKGISGDSNYYPVNVYKNDISRQMIDVGANPPFLNGGGVSRKRNKSLKKKQNGGTLSNFMAQDLINLGRNFQYGIGSAYNALAGYNAPINPLPWKDQFPNNPYVKPLNPAVI